MLKSQRVVQNCQKLSKFECLGHFEIFFFFFTWNWPKIGRHKKKWNFSTSEGVYFHQRKILRTFYVMQLLDPNTPWPFFGRKSGKNTKKIEIPTWPCWQLPPNTIMMDSLYPWDVEQINSFDLMWVYVGQPTWSWALEPKTCIAFPLFHHKRAKTQKNIEKLKKLFYKIPILCNFFSLES